MASPTARRSGAAGASVAEVVLLPSMKNCFVNLPAALVAPLLNSNTLTQNVVVELTFRAAAPAGAEARTGRPASTEARSIYMGWTGMQAQSKLSPLIGRDSIKSSGGRQEQEVATIELDATFGRRAGLSEGTKVCRYNSMNNTFRHGQEEFRHEPVLFGVCRLMACVVGQYIAPCRSSASAYNPHRAIDPN